MRLIITREKDFHEWDVENLLEPLKREIELREEHREAERKGSREFVKRSGWKRSPSSAQVLLTKSRVEACAFCLDMHRHEDCNRVNTQEKRKELLVKYSRCFNCLRKGHLARHILRNLQWWAKIYGRAPASRPLLHQISKERPSAPDLSLDTMPTKTV